MTAGAPDPAREAAGPPGLSAARLDAMLAEADQALAAADRALAEGYPGPRPGGSRCTPCTCPPTGSARAWPRSGDGRL